MIGYPGVVGVFNAVDDGSAGECEGVLIREWMRSDLADCDWDVESKGRIGGEPVGGE